MRRGTGSRVLRRPTSSCPRSKPPTTSMSLPRRRFRTVTPPALLPKGTVPRPPGAGVGVPPLPPAVGRVGAHCGQIQVRVAAGVRPDGARGRVRFRVALGWLGSVTLSARRTRAMFGSGGSHAASERCHRRLTVHHQRARYSAAAATDREARTSVMSARPAGPTFTGTRTGGGAVAEVAFRKSRPLCLTGTGCIYDDAWARPSQPDVARHAAECRTFGRVAVTQVGWSVLHRRDVLRVSVSRVPTSRSAELHAAGPRSPGRCRCCRTSRVLSRRVSTGTGPRRRQGP